MKKAYFIILVVFGSILSNAQSFIPKASFAGNARGQAISFSVGGYGYYGTGNWSNGTAETSDMWQYNPTSNAWSSVAALPMGMQQAVGFSIGGYAYAGIGWKSGNAFSSFYQYNPTSNTWTSVASFTGTLTNDAVGFNIGSYGYVGMGAQPYSSCLTEFYQYNPTSNTWSSEASFTGTARRDAMGVGSGNFGFVGGGNNGSGTNYFDNYQYNPTSNTWTSVATCPDTTFYGHISFELNGIIYVCAKQMWAYNVSGNSWTQVANYPDSLMVNGAGGAFTINGNGYIIESGSTNFWEFNPSGCSQMVYDTSRVTVYDTLIRNVNDTVYTHLTVYDTTRTQIFDTITTNQTVYDTVTHYIAVTDTLIINANLTGILPPNNTNELKVYPNPANTDLYIDCGDYATMSGYTIKIINAIGQTEFSTAITQQQYDINLNSWSGHGVYVLTISDPSNTVISTKEIVIQ